MGILNDSLVKCIFCDKELVFMERNNPYPLADRNDGFVCCGECNRKYVIPERKGFKAKHIITPNNNMICDKGKKLLVCIKPNFTKDYIEDFDSFIDESTEGEIKQ